MNFKKSKILNRIFILILAATLLSLVNTAPAQYQIDWYTIDGGGGRSTGGAFILEGTIGQPDAGNMIGGSYTLAGGFWPGSQFCIVDILDLYHFSTYWLMTTPGVPGDLIGNDGVNLYDYNYLANFWLQMCPNGWPWW